MICLKCDNEEFRAGEAEILQEFKGDSLQVLTPVMVCTQCGWHTVGNDQIDELRNRTADVYRQKHNLLTSVQIKAHREELGMNQLEFAHALEVGDVTVKRWETWLVQKKTSDDHIRRKVAQMLEEQDMRNSVVLWLAGNCARGSAVIKNGGIQLRPPQKELEPMWAFAVAHARQDRPIHQTAAYATALPVTA